MQKILGWDGSSSDTDSWWNVMSTLWKWWIKLQNLDFTEICSIYFMSKSFFSDKENHYVIITRVALQLLSSINCRAWITNKPPTQDNFEIMFGKLMLITQSWWMIAMINLVNMSIYIVAQCLLKRLQPNYSVNASHH